MREDIQTIYYIFSFFENSFEVIFKKVKLGFWGWFTILFFNSCFVSLAIIGFIGASYFHAVLGVVATAASIALCIVKYSDFKKREKTFILKIDCNGVLHIDANANCFLPWEEISSFGIITETAMSSIAGSRAHPQTCLYFSKILCNEAYLRKLFWRASGKRYRHCSSENIITFCFEEKNIDEKLLARINTYLYKYSDKSKECNYIR